MRKIIFWVLYTISMVLIPLAVLEIAVRFTHSPLHVPLPPAPYCKMEHLPYSNRPHFAFMRRSLEFAYEHRTNSQGFRDVEHTFEKPDGVFRVLGLGDSFTEGVGAQLSDTYLSRFAAGWRAAPPNDKKIEMIQAGIAGYDTKSERLMLEHYGMRYDPDLVTVGFFSNDLKEALVGVDYEISKEGYLLGHEGHQGGPLLYWLYLRSGLARILISHFAAYRAQSVLEDYLRNEKAWKKVEQEYVKMQKFLEPAGVPLVVINIPASPPWTRDHAHVSQRFGEMCKTLNLHCVDMFPLMRDHEDYASLYWKQDYHCTPKGYDFIAESLFAYARSHPELLS